MPDMRKTFVGVAALVAVTMIGVPSAHAVDWHGNCGTTVYHYGLIATNGCFGFYADGNMIHEAKWRTVAYSNPSDWTDCDLSIALFVDNVQTRKTTVSCLSLARTYPYEGYVQAAPTWGPSPGYCYKAVVAWTAVYQGNSVGSQGNAYSVEYCRP